VSEPAVNDGTAVNDESGAGELSMPLGEAMFTQRSIRRMRQDPIPVEHLRLVVAAAAKAPNGGNRQICRLLVTTDKEGRDDPLERVGRTSAVEVSVGDGVTASLPELVVAITGAGRGDRARVTRR